MQALLSRRIRSGRRLFAMMTSNTSLFHSPPLTMRLSGMLKPSEMLSKLIKLLPGCAPPLSATWTPMTAKKVSSPSQKTGRI